MKFRTDEECQFKEARTLNKMLKNTVSTRRCIDIYDTKLIKRASQEQTEVYMFDRNHLSNFGANQSVDKIILSRINKMIK